MRALSLIALVVLAAGTVEAQERPRLRPSLPVMQRQAQPARLAQPVLLPRPRPPEAPPRVAEKPPEPPAPAQVPAAPSEPPPPSACLLRLTGGLAIAKQVPPPTGTGECGIDDPVSLEAVLLADGRRASVTPPATLRCDMAEAIVHWVRDDVVPRIKALGSPLASLDNYASYECRGRNRVVGARMSEHGRGNALDVRGFALADGRKIGLTDYAVSSDLRTELRASTCARFTTVLGPGSDGYHESHVHMDIIQRRGGYRLCQWDVRTEPEVPLPRPRPAEAPPRAL